MALKKVITVLNARPHHLWKHARGYALFMIARLLGAFVFKAPRYKIGRNVRIQRVSCILASGDESRIVIGNDTVIYENAEVHAHGAGHVEIGEGSIIGDARIHSRAKITLGARTLTSWNVTIQDFDAHPTSMSLRADQMRWMTDTFHPRFAPLEKKPTPITWNFPAEPVTIGTDVWIGQGATILKGARIGDGCIIAAGAVVTRGEYPARSILAGNPAKIVKEAAP